MTNHIIDSDLLREIDNKLKYMEENKINFKENYNLYLKEEANQHSARIELPKAILYDQNIESNLKLSRLRELEYFQSSLSSAWEYGSKHLNLPLNEDFIRELTGKIDPSFFNSYSEDLLESGMAPFRRITDGVHISGAKHTPPYPAKIPNEIKKFLNQAKILNEELNKGKINPLELAAFTHFNTVRIHPFSDANGRTSRLLQNLILNHFKLPVAIVYEGERRSYHTLLDNANEGYSDRYNQDFSNISQLSEISDQEKQFYTFIADKVNVSLDSILDKPDKRN